MAKYWITKYALSGPIETIDGEIWELDGSYVKDAKSTYNSLYRLGREAFATLEEAKADAEDRRIKRIASLRKQIAKLEGMEFV